MAKYLGRTELSEIIDLLLTIQTYLKMHAVFDLCWDGIWAKQNYYLCQTMFRLLAEQTKLHYLLVIHGTRPEMQLLSHIG